ncbi:hypothetical protein Anapl_12837 [Anas platyrhynchos]|uniref:Uncharacterized protein n=1 Tax=Anas platyrhynchos TaxID=8839 RepID=R0LLC3_ANAPL|nr:hypothetical protein Anapl_12837 [Anas platyrhynchos]
MNRPYVGEQPPEHWDKAVDHCQAYSESHGSQGKGWRETAQKHSQGPCTGSRRSPLGNKGFKYPVEEWGSAQAHLQNLSYRKCRNHNCKSYPEELSLVNKNEQCKLGCNNQLTLKTVGNTEQNCAFGGHQQLCGGGMLPSLCKVTIFFQSSAYLFYQIIQTAVCPSSLLLCIV